MNSKMKKILTGLLSFVIVASHFAPMAFAQEQINAEDNTSVHAHYSQDENKNESDENSSQQSDENSSQQSDENSSQQSDENSSQQSDENSSQQPDENSSQLPENNSSLEKEESTVSVRGKSFESDDIVPYDLPNNEDLFSGYVEYLFSNATEVDSTPSLYSEYNRQFLTQPQQLIYDELKRQIREIAAGDRESTIMNVTDAIGDLTFTAEILGIPSVNTNAEGDELDETTRKALYDQIFGVVWPLMNDSPYEMFWFDKTRGYGFTGLDFDIQKQGSESKIVVKNLSYALAVSHEFRKFMSNPNNDPEDFSASLKTDKFMVNTQVIKGIQNSSKNARRVVSEAQEIVSQKGLTGRAAIDEQLYYFKDYICKWVNYNHAAVDQEKLKIKTLYGNPWQLIYGFDEDLSTDIVCEGYSKCFMYLCDMAFDPSVLQCHLVTGIGHMWNIVQMDGVNYIVDITWCDQDGGDNPGEYKDLDNPKNPYPSWSNDAYFMINADPKTSYQYDIGVRVIPGNREGNFPWPSKAEQGPNKGQFMEYTISYPGNSHVRTYDGFTISVTDPNVLFLEDEHAEKAKKISEVTITIDPLVAGQSVPAPNATPFESEDGTVSNAITFWFEAGANGRADMNKQVKPGTPVKFNHKYAPVIIIFPPAGAEFDGVKGVEKATFNYKGSAAETLSRPGANGIGMRNDGLAQLYPKHITTAAKQDGTFLISFRLKLENESVDYTQSVTGTDGKLAELPKVEIPGFIFKGWYIPSFFFSDTPVTTETVFTKDTIVVGKMEIDPNYVDPKAERIITFDANGGKIIITDQSGKKTEHDKVQVKTFKHILSGQLPPVPVKEGYRFDGWYDAEGKAATAYRVFKADTTVYAKWSNVNELPAEGEYKITFDANGGEIDFTEAETVGNRVTKYPYVHKAGYSFQGWFNDHGERVGTDTKYFADTYLTAQWKKSIVIDNPEIKDEPIINDNYNQVDTSKNENDKKPVNKEKTGSINIDSADVAKENPKGEIKPDTIKKTLESGKKTIVVDNMKGKAVAARLYIDTEKASKLEKPIFTRVYLNADYKDNAKTKEIFAKYFSNKVETMTFVQNGDFGMKIKVAAKIDLSKFEGDKLYLYSYNIAENKYQKAGVISSKPAEDGYTYFEISKGNTLIITDKPLTAK